MPTGFVRKLAKKHHMSIQASEQRWAKAKRLASQENKGGDYAYITSIYKSLMHEGNNFMSSNRSLPTFKSFLLNELDTETTPGQIVDIEPNIDSDEFDVDDETRDMGGPTDAGNDEDFGDDDEFEPVNDEPIDLENDERFMELKHDADRGNVEAKGIVRRLERLNQTEPSSVEWELQHAHEKMFGQKGLKMSNRDTMHHMPDESSPKFTMPPEQSGEQPPMGESYLSLKKTLLGDLMLGESDEDDDEIESTERRQKDKDDETDEEVDDERDEDQDKERDQEKEIEDDTVSESKNWGVKHTGQNSRQSIAQLKKEAASAKRAGDTKRVRQKDFAIRAKKAHGGKKSWKGVTAK